MHSETSDATACASVAEPVVGPPPPNMHRIESGGVATRQSVVLVDHVTVSEVAHATTGSHCWSSLAKRSELSSATGTDPDAACPMHVPSHDGPPRPELSPTRAGTCKSSKSVQHDVMSAVDQSELPQPVDDWKPVHSVHEWTKVMWEKLPLPLRHWIARFEPSMATSWQTMFAENREVLPVLAAYATSFEPSQRRGAIEWLFESKGLLTGDSDMFRSFFGGIPEDFGKIDFLVTDEVDEVKYVLAVGDRFVSLLDDGGFSKALRWDPLPRVTDPTHFRAGGLHSKSARKAWKKLHEEGPGVSKWVLHWVENRVWYERLQPLEADHSARHAACLQEPDKHEFMHNKIMDMLKVGAVVRLPEGEKPMVLTRLSLAPKPGAGEPWRVIMDMRPENSMYRSLKVKMEHLNHVTSIIARGDLLWSLDLKSAYYSVGVDPRLGNCMGFEWQGQYYRFTVLPFGFKGSSHAFVKIGRNILKKWRAEGPGQWQQRFGHSSDPSMRGGSKAMIYIDDSLGAHKYFGAAVWQRNAQMLELESLGFSLSAKGELLPFPAVKFLGMIIHLGRDCPSWHVPLDKMQSILAVSNELVTDMSEEGQVLCKKAAKCIGKLVSASRAVPIGQLLFRELNACIYSNGAPAWSGHTLLSEQAIQDLRFIIQCLLPYNLRGSPIWIDSIVVPVDKVLVQDAGPRAVGYALHDAPTDRHVSAGSIDPLPMAPAEATRRGLRAMQSVGLPPIASIEATRWDDHVRHPIDPSDIPAVELATSIGTIELKDEEAEWPHVHKELLGVLLALRSLQAELRNKRICLFVDATATVCYLVRWGGRSSRLTQLVRQIWGVCARWGIRIVQVSHISGDKMISAGVDALSRPAKFARKCEVDRDDWRLLDCAFEQVQELSLSVFGSPTTVDRMASRANTKLPRFNSISAVDPDSECFSAFGSNWAVTRGEHIEVSYCFPPFRLVPRVIQHIQECKARAVLVVPYWPSQSWWVALWQMAVGHRFFRGLPVFERISDGQWCPVLQSSFTAVAVAVDGRLVPCRAYMSLVSPKPSYSNRALVQSYTDLKSSRACSCEEQPQREGSK